MTPSYARSIPPDYLRAIMVESIDSELTHHRKLLSMTSDHVSQVYWERKIKLNESKRLRLMEMTS